MPGIETVSYTHLDVYKRQAGESVGVERRRIGHLFAVECDIPVGLIADEEDVVAERLALLGQDLCADQLHKRWSQTHHYASETLLPMGTFLLPLDEFRDVYKRQPFLYMA